MTTPSTSIYVRPGWTSSTWTYSGASIGASPIAAVAFSFDSDGPLIDRGSFQSSVDGGHSWTTYAMQSDGDGAYMPAAGTLWRFVDQASGDTGTAERFVMHWKLADGSIVSSNAGVVPDNQPLGMTYEHNYVFSTQQAGDAVAALTPIDTGAPNGGLWVIEDQSQPGLFGVAMNADTGAAELVIANPGAMPAAGDAISVTMHYYDRYQLDTGGVPIRTTYGVTDTLVFTVKQGTTQDLPAFGADLALGAASGQQAAPAVASLSGGGFVTAWQGSGDAIWAQVRDASGAALAAPFAVSAVADGAAEAQPAVAGLGAGRFVVAYTVQQDGASSVAYRIVEANGSVGHQFAAGASGDASMPTVTALADGSFVLGWRSGGQVHLLHESATGTAIGAEQVAGALGTAYSPNLTALHNGDYVVAWGEIGDGNVYAALGSNPGAALQVTADGAAASISTAAPLPHVAALAGGGFVVAWDSYANDPYGFAVSDIFFQRYDNAGNALGQPGQASMQAGTGRYDAAVSALPDGGFVIGWQAQGGDGDANGVFGRRFGADGSAIDALEFQVNQLSVGDQASPALAVLGNGGVATAWVDTHDGVSTIEARVLAGSGAATDSGASSGSGGSVTPAPGGSTGGSTGTADPGTGGSGSGSTGTGVGSTGGSTGTGSGSAGGTVDTGGTGSSGSGSTGSGGGGSVTVPAPELLTGTGAANVFTSAGGSHAIDGGDGMDTVVYLASHAGVAVKAGPSGFTVSGNGIQDALVNVERLQFSDASLALDINGKAGEAYRLYQAAFDRVPDLPGLGYWIKMLDNGVSLDDAAHGFVTSREFADLYGANATDAQFVHALYQNVLHRSAEQAGYDFWIAALEQHGAQRAEVLSHFSESAENQVQVIGSIQDGILFTPWG